MRSPPERSTRMAMPGYLASNALPIRSATGRSTAVYQTTLPSFCAAAISSGVTFVGAGAAASAPRPDAGRASEAAARPCSTCRRDVLFAAISVSSIPLRGASRCGQPIAQGEARQPPRGLSRVAETPWPVLKLLDQEVEEYAHFRDLLRAGREYGEHA